MNAHSGEYGCISNVLDQTCVDDVLSSFEMILPMGFLRGEMEIQINLAHLIDVDEV